jgi:proteasome lid subunit RPN8/RPN11
LSEDLFSEMCTYATVNSHLEICGFLVGDPNGMVRRVMPLTSVGGARSFFVDPYAQFQAEIEIARSGLSILAIYHTHPDGGARLSATDIEFARNWDCAHVVIAVDSRRSLIREIRAYAISAETVSEVEISEA